MSFLHSVSGWKNIDWTIAGQISQIQRQFINI